MKFKSLLCVSVLGLLALSCDDNDEAKNRVYTKNETTVELQKIGTEAIDLVQAQDLQPVIDVIQDCSQYFSLLASDNYEMYPLLWDIRGRVEVNNGHHNVFAAYSSVFVEAVASGNTPSFNRKDYQQLLAYDFTKLFGKIVLHSDTIDDGGGNVSIMNTLRLDTTYTDKLLFAFRDTVEGKNDSVEMSLQCLGKVNKMSLDMMEYMSSSYEEAQGEEAYTIVDTMGRYYEFNVPEVIKFAISKNGVEMGSFSIVTSLNSKFVLDCYGSYYDDYYYPYNGNYYPIRMNYVPVTSDILSSSGDSVVSSVEFDKFSLGIALDVNGYVAKASWLLDGAKGFETKISISIKKNNIISMNAFVSGDFRSLASSTDLFETSEEDIVSKLSAVQAEINITDRIKLTAGVDDVKPLLSMFDMLDKMTPEQRAAALKRSSNHISTASNVDIFLDNSIVASIYMKYFDATEDRSADLRPVIKFKADDSELIIDQYFNVDNFGDLINNAAKKIAELMPIIEELPKIPQVK